MPSRLCSCSGFACLIVPAEILKNNIRRTTSGTEEDDEEGAVKHATNAEVEKVVKSYRHLDANFHCPLPSCIYFCRCFTDGYGKPAFQSYKNLVLHYARSHGEKFFTCVLCNKQFGLHKDYVAHNSCCSSLFLCRFCQMVFKTKAALVMHVRRHHKQETGHGNGIPSISAAVVVGPNDQMTTSGIGAVRNLCNQQTPTSESISYLWQARLNEQEVQTVNDLTDAYSNTLPYFAQTQTASTMTSNIEMTSMMVDGSTSPITSAMRMLENEQHAGKSTQTDLNPFGNEQFQFLTDERQPSQNIMINGFHELNGTLSLGGPDNDQYSSVSSNEHNQECEDLYRSLLGIIDDRGEMKNG